MTREELEVANDEISTRIRELIAIIQVDSDEHLIEALDEVLPEEE